MEIEHQWLKYQINTIEFLSNRLVSFPEIGIRDYQVDLENVNLLQNLQSSDELWIYSSPKEDWDTLCGRAGIAQVRDNQIIDSYGIFMN
jgi:hypothetical protein